MCREKGGIFLQGPGAGAFEGLRGLLGSVPDNAFQRARVGESFNLQTRALAVILGGMKLFGVGFISSIGTLSVSNGVWAARKVMNPELTKKPLTKRSPIFKTAFVYGSLLGLSFLSLTWAALGTRLTPLWGKCQHYDNPSY